MLDTELRVLYSLSHLIFITSLCGICYYYQHFRWKNKQKRTGTEKFSAFLRDSRLTILSNSQSLSSCQISQRCCGPGSGLFPHDWNGFILPLRYAPVMLDYSAETSCTTSVAYYSSLPKKNHKTHIVLLYLTLVFLLSHEYVLPAVATAL